MATVASITGVNGETGATVGTVNVSSTTHTTAGTYASDSWSFTGATNYNNISATTISDSIGKASPVCNISGDTFPYDGLAHGATGSCTGVGSDGTLAGLSLGSSFTNVPGGTANWTFTDVSGNYSNTSGSASITITKVTPTTTLAVTNSPQTYTGSPIAAVVSAQSPSTPGSVTNVKYDGSTTVPTDANTYAITADFVPTDTTNYNSLLGLSAGDFTIGKATSTVTVNCPAAPQSYTGSQIIPCSASYQTTDGLTGTLTVNYSANVDVGTANASAAYAGDANHVGSNNSATFQIKDTTAPVVTVPSDITAEATGASGAEVEFEVSASDNHDGSLPASCVPVSGSTFALGSTPVNCSATDAGGNTGSASFNVVVEDTTDPVLTLPADITDVEATSPAGATVEFAVSASDIVDGPITPGCDATSGDTFPVGTTTVHCSATDAHENVTSDSFTITVVDTTGPVITVPTVADTEATSAAGAVVTYTAPTATDIVDGTDAVSCDKNPGDTFVLGTTTVHCSSVDIAGNPSAATFAVTVVDTTAPEVTVPADITAEATSSAGAVVTFSSSAADIYDGAVATSCLPASGSTFPLGTNSVTCSATDAAGNTGSASFNVKVEDTTAPALHDTPADFSIEATDASGATVTYTDPTATDDVDAAVDVACLPASGSTLSLGAHLVTCTATDDAGNFSTSTFTVTVEDTTAPVIDIHGEVDAEAVGILTPVSYEAPATHDAVDGAGVAVCTPVSGSDFDLGATTINCSITDSNGNTATSSFNVVVTDSTAPVIADHDDVLAEATGTLTTVSYVSPATSDAVDGAGTATCSPLSGTGFALGSTAVNCTATDAAENPAAPTTFHVIVSDSTDPVIADHDDVTAEATSSTGAAVSYISPNVTDNYDATVAATCLPASGSVFPIGNTTVTCNHSDSSGNAAEPTTFTVHVLDTTAPTIADHDDVTAEATGTLTVVDYTNPVATDDVDGTDEVSCAPVSGSSFPLGPTIVTCDTEDSAGNAADSTTFTVTITDTTDPILTVPADITTEATGATGAAVEFAVSASDIVDGPITPDCDATSGDTFPVGTTTVHCSATDAHGNVTSDSFDIIVTDTTAPTIADHDDVAIEAAGELTSVTYDAPTTHDTVDGDAVATCMPVSGSDFALGTTEVDCSITDSNGNTANSSFNVVVSDTTAPTIHLNGLSVVNLGTGDSYVDDGATASDLVDGNLTDQIVVGGDTVDTATPGTYVITYDVSDSAGNATDQVTRTVNVADDDAPTIADHDDVTAEATSAAGAAVSYDAPTAEDNTDGTSDVVTCLPASGSTFPIGSTPVTCNAEDAAHNAATPTTFNIIVTDTTAPIIDTHAPIVVESSTATTVDFTAPTSHDLVDGDLPSVCSPASGSTFPLGTTPVSCGKTDAYGNVGTPAVFNVTVQDTTDPVVSITTPTDDATTGPATTIVYSVSDGTISCTLDDVSIPCDSSSSTALSSLSGGSHTFTVTATDEAGNTGSDSVTWTVDATGPVITLVGDADVSVEVGTTYTDPGATADDGSAVVTTGSVNTAVIGDYLLHYNATDAFGNAAAEVTRTVHVTDHPAPIVTHQSASNPTDTTIEVKWTTDHASTSRVVYGTDPVSDEDSVAAHEGGDANWGYPHSTTVDNTLTTDHDVVVTGLDNGTTYYFRGISHGSPEGESAEVSDTTTTPAPQTATLVATKIVCDDESYLPNLMAASHDTTANTASDFLAANSAHCHPQEGWNFEWGDQNAPDGGDDTVGHVAGYTTFGPTDASGVASATVPLAGLTQIHAREVLEDGYIGYTYSAHPDNSDTVSAEFSCSGDGLNYDNWEWISNPTNGATYYCVAWNVATVQTPPPPASVSVHIAKYVDGVHATAENADSASFPMLTTYNGNPQGSASNVPYTLDPNGWSGDPAYEASFSNADAGADYSTWEDTSTSTVGESCDDSHAYQLLGYSTSTESFADAAEQELSLTAPDFHNLQNDEYVIVWNKTCGGDVTPPPVENSCPVPDALGDTTAETVHDAPAGEHNLQTILDDAGYSLDVNSDQQQYQSWNVTAGSEVHIDASFVNKYASFNQVFGYYTDGDMSTWTPVFKTASVTGYASVPLASAGPFTVTVPAGATTIGFAIKSYNGNTLADHAATLNSLNTGSADKVLAYNPASDKYVLAFEDTTGGDNDFNDLVVAINLSCEDTTPPVDECTNTDVAQAIVSDTTTTVDGDPSVALQFIHSNWTASIPGATWIWSQEPLADPSAESSATFTKTFTVTGTPTDGTLMIAADNSYSVTLNGHDVCSDAGEVNYTAEGQDNCNIPAEDFVTGTNTLVFTVTNFAQDNATQETNPAGLLYKLSWNEDQCDTPPPPTECPTGTHADGNQCVPDTAQTFECSDQIDNDGDQLIDAQDPGCHTDGNADNPDSYDPEDPSEQNDSDQNPPITCDPGQHEENNECVPDDTTPTCDADETLIDGQCVPNEPAPQHVTHVHHSGHGGGGGGFSGQVLGAEDTNVCALTVDTYMRRGYRNDPEQVKILQQDILNALMGANLTVDGVYGPKTEAAVKAFQLKYADDILKPWGISAPSGIFYTTSLVKAKNLLCSTSTLGIPSSLVNWSQNSGQVPAHS